MPQGEGVAELTEHGRGGVMETRAEPRGEVHAGLAQEAPAAELTEHGLVVETEEYEALARFFEYLYSLYTALVKLGQCPGK